MASTGEPGDTRKATPMSMSLSPTQETIDITPGNTVAQQPRDGTENTSLAVDSTRTDGSYGEDEHRRASAIPSIFPAGQERASIPPRNTAARPPGNGTENAQFGEDSRRVDEIHGGGELRRASAIPSITAPPKNIMPASTLAYKQTSKVGSDVSAGDASDLLGRPPARKPQRDAATIPAQAPPIAPPPPHTLPPPHPSTVGMSPNRQRQHLPKSGIGRRWLSMKRTLTGKQPYQGSEASSDDSWACETARVVESEHIRQVGADSTIEVASTDETPNPTSQEPTVELNTPSTQPRPPENKRHGRFSQFFGKIADRTSILR